MKLDFVRSYGLHVSSEFRRFLYKGLKFNCYEVMHDLDKHFLSGVISAVFKGPPAHHLATLQQRGVAVLSLSHCPPLHHFYHVYVGIWCIETSNTKSMLNLWPEQGFVSEGFGGNISF